VNETAKIFTHPKWKTDVDALRKLGVDISTAHEDDDIAELLPEPQYGELVLGALTDDERAVFVQLRRIEDQRERLAREYYGRALERLGTGIRSSDVHQSLHENIANNEQAKMVFDSEEEKVGYFRLDRLISLLHATLYWSLSERFNCPHYGVGIRSKFRAVRTQERA